MGNHESLMEKQGIYFELVSAQSGDKSEKKEEEKSKKKTKTVVDTKEKEVEQKEQTVTRYLKFN